MSDDLLTEAPAEALINDSVRLGAKKDKPDKRDLRIAGITPALAVPPQEFSIEDLYPSKNQFQRGSCTSQAQTHHKERQEGGRMSARFVMALTKEFENNQEYGAYTRNTFKTVKDYGVCKDELCPEPGPAMSWEEYINVSKIPQPCFDEARKHKSDSYWRVENDIDHIRAALVTHKNSIVMSMEWHTEFNNANLIEGVLPTKFYNPVGGHAVDIVGFSDKNRQLKIKNSWGKDWGDNGYFYMPYEVFPKVVWDCWCSLDIKADMPVDNYYGEKRTWAAYLREQQVAFNPWLRSKLGRAPNNREIKGLAYGFWDFDTVFKGLRGDLWLRITKPEAKKHGLI